MLHYSHYSMTGAIHASALQEAEKQKVHDLLLMVLVGNLS